VAEKVIEKLKRISRDLAESVRTEIDLRDHIHSMSKDMQHLKRCITCYVQEKEKVSNESEAISFIKGYYEAKSKDNVNQMKFGFADKK